MANGVILGGWKKIGEIIHGMDAKVNNIVIVAKKS